MQLKSVFCCHMETTLITSRLSQYGVGIKNPAIPNRCNVKNQPDIASLFMCKSLRRTLVGKRISYSIHISIELSIEAVEEAL